MNLLNDYTLEDFVNPDKVNIEGILVKEKTIEITLELNSIYPNNFQKTTLQFHYFFLIQFLMELSAF